jgi:hypothetical protein
MSSPSKVRKIGSSSVPESLRVCSISEKKEVVGVEITAEARERYQYDDGEADSTCDCCGGSWRTWVALGLGGKSQHLWKGPIGLEREPDIYNCTLPGCKQATATEDKRRKELKASQSLEKKKIPKKKSDKRKQQPSPPWPGGSKLSKKKSTKKKGPKTKESPKEKSSKKQKKG